MDPTTTCCLNVAGAARGQTGQGNMGIHSRKDKRLIERWCGNHGYMWSYQSLVNRILIED